MSPTHAGQVSEPYHPSDGRRATRRQLAGPGSSSGDRPIVAPSSERPDQPPRRGSPEGCAQRSRRRLGFGSFIDLCAERTVRCRTGSPGVDLCVQRSSRSSRRSPASSSEDARAGAARAHPGAGAQARAGRWIGGDGGESNSPSRTLRRRPLRACPMICRRPPGRASALCRTVQSRVPRSGLTPDYASLIRIAAPLDDASTTREAEAASTLTLPPKRRERESTGGCQVLLFAA